MSAAEHAIHARQRALPLEVSARCTLVTLEFVRNLRGCDAQSVRASVADATHPQCLRWAFDLAVRPDGLKRELRFWKEDALGCADRWLEPAVAIGRILGARERFARGEIEVAWTVHPTTIGRLLRAGEITEVNHKLTRASLAAFLERRLQ
jgi:hypothetical protein